MKKWYVASFIFVITISLFGGLRMVAPTAMRSVFSCVLYPFLRIQYSITSPIHRYFQHQSQKKTLTEQLQSLESEYELLAQENIVLRASLDYQADVKELINFKNRYNTPQQNCAHILLKHIDQNTHFILVDQGSMHGVSPDMVAVYKNYLLGKVVDVYPYYSKVLLTTDKTCKVAAYCTTTNATGIHEGCNAQKTILNRVSHLSNVHQGSLVFSSGKGMVFPRGFALGKVEVCKLNGLFYDVQVKPLIDLQKIEYCYLIKKGAEL